MPFLHRHRGLTPYLLLAPGVAWLAVFFLVPLGFLAYQSLQSGSIDFGYAFTWSWGNYWDAIRNYHAQFERSLVYAGIATVIALLVSYPVAYWIAFRGGRWKNLLLLFIVAPFFVTYLIRTLAWQTILSDHGLVVRTHFTPDIVKVNQGDEVYFHWTNLEQDDDIAHGFGILWSSKNMQIEPGETKTMHWTADKVGINPFYCSNFCSALHQEMQGYIEVRPKGSPQASVQRPDAKTIAEINAQLAAR